ncbi:TetR/AcrR family transcriptional regulator [Specibacter cremeus]|uniref:TetR/AcrR family transcriptional regulator n=1 Tax=Specibacter cremeus TaxID=1629051 RepID=UPI000F7A4260|nr:TetR/AcrR family transcriptional regulator [Specibacter cremeus]
MSLAESISEMEEAVRSLRRDARRRQVLDAAVAVMQRTGFHEMSMQALANEASVSVGLLYTYFGGKEEILLAAVLDILNSFRDQLRPAMDAVGDDPVERLAAGFRRYTEIVDENRDAVLLTYRESRTLDHAGLEQIKELEVETSAPLRDAVEAGMARGIIRSADPDLVTYDLMMLAHAWALKAWHFEPKYSVETFIRAQTALVLQSLIPPSRRSHYRHLVEG